MKKLCVIFGGASVEHDVSIITGMQLADNLKSKNIEKLYLNRENKLFLVRKIENFKNFSHILEKNKLIEVIIYDNAVYKKSPFFKKLFDIECVISCCHGGVGENGDLAGFLSMQNVRVTSPNSLAGHITMDKTLTKLIVSEIAPVVRGVKISRDNVDELGALLSDFPDDLIVKPNSLGSSIGVKICDKSNCRDQIDAIFEMKDDALVEERIVNLVEYNQACFRDGDDLVLSEIEQPISKHKILTFADKYEHEQKSKVRDRIIPAKMSEKLNKLISNYTTSIYKRLNLNGVVRIDYLFDKDNKKLYFNEVNTIPGSMAFYLYEGKGIDYITLVERLVANATEPKQYAYFETDILHEMKNE